MAKQHKPIGLMTMERLYGKRAEETTDPAELRRWLRGYVNEVGGLAAFTLAAQSFIYEKLGA